MIDKLGRTPGITSQKGPKHKTSTSNGGKHKQLINNNRIAAREQSTVDVTAWGGASVVVDFLFIVAPITGVCTCSMFCCTLLYVRSSIAIVLMGKRELVALLNLSSWCLVMVERLFLAVPRGCLRFVIVVFPDHTHSLFLNILYCPHLCPRLCCC